MRFRRLRKTLTEKQYRSVFTLLASTKPFRSRQGRHVKTLHIAPLGIVSARPPQSNISNRARHVLWAALLVASAFTTPLFAQREQATLERGFQPGKLYQFGDIDAVNVFNGNLVITLPIGQTYPLNGGRSYGLTLSYNSKIWELMEGSNGQRAKPSARSNAGSGWVVGMGRYIAVNANQVITSELSPVDVYEAPDGGDHRFERVGADPGCTSSFLAEVANRCSTYTMDGTNLRMRYFVNAREIDFPDGTTHRFEKDSAGAWYLQSMRNVLGNESVTVSHAMVGIPPQCVAPTALWTITAPRQTSYVCFKNHEVDGQQRPMVDRVVLPSVYGTTSVYAFTYVDQTQISRPAEDTEDDAAAALFLDPHGFHHLPTLQSVTLPDLSTFLFTATGPLVGSMQLPTRATISYTYGAFPIPPPEPCAGELDIGVIQPGETHRRNPFATTGVIQRDVRAALPAGHPADQPEVQTWTYVGTRERRNPNSPDYRRVLNCGTTQSPENPELYDEFVVRVTDPFHIRTDNHFSVWGGDGPWDTGLPSPGGALREYYGFPYGVYDSNQNRYLSREVFDCNVTPCRLMRSTYVRNDKVPNTVLPFPNRLASQSTIEQPAAICPDGKPCQTAFDNSDWDDLSHYRTVDYTSNFGRGGDTRRVVTSWNKRNGVPVTPTLGQPWLTNFYEDTQTTAKVPQRNSDGTVTGAEVDDTAIEQACFSPTTGFLQAKRLLAGGAPGPTDLLSVFNVDGVGNLATESYYGGEGHPINSNEANLCFAVQNLSDDIPTYQVTHTWSSGVLVASQADGASFKSLDLTEDSHTGVILSSRDTAGLETVYTYDEDGKGRLRSVTPPGRVPTSYDYFNATSHGNAGSEVLDSPAFVEEQTVSDDPSLGVLRHEYQYDSLGRLWREKNAMSDSTWSMRETVWDALSRKRSVSEPVGLGIVPSAPTPPSPSELALVPPSKTTFAYDFAGRTLSVTAPDSTVTTNAYTADGRVIRTLHNVATVTGAQDAVTTELYDGAGRLAGVQESSAPGDGNITTIYRYDVGGRMTHANTTWGGVSQNRDFLYDHRGLLTKEIHPENGTTNYPSYDARGHVLSKQVAADASFNLTYTYDFAERLLQVSSGNRPLKAFEYGAEDELEQGPIGGPTRIGGEGANHINGKLQSAVRWTYDPSGGTFSVRETYVYGDDAGNLTQKTTDIDRIAPNGTVAAHYQTTVQSYEYDDLGERSTLTYPTCGAPQCGTAGFASISPTYRNGSTTAVPGFADSIAYAPNGMVTSIHHSNGVVDTQTLDPSGLPRPHAISVSGFSQPVCSPVVITTTPASGSILAKAAGSASVAAVPGATYAWTIAGGTFTSATNGTNVTFTAGCSGNVTLGVTVTAACGPATASAQLPITAPAVALSGSATIDNGQQVSLQAVLTGAAPFSVTWSDGTTNTVQTGQSGTATLTVHPSINTTYTVAATDANGCAANVSGTAVVTVRESPSFTFTCAGRTCNFVGAGSVNGRGIVTWNWTFGDGTTGTQQSVSHTYGGSLDNYAVLLSMTDTAGQASSIQRTVTVCTPPVITMAPVSASTTTAAPDVTAQFTVSGAVTEVHWYEGTGTSNEILSTDPTQRLSKSGNQVRLHSLTATSATVWARIYTCGGPTSGGVKVDTVPVTLSVVSCTWRVLGIAGQGETYMPTVPVELRVAVDPEESETNHYTYQWYRGSDHSVMVGSTGPTVFVSSTSESYYCVVGHACGSSTTFIASPSGYVWLYGSCDLPPLLTLQTAATAEHNSIEGVTFTATVDWPDVTYQWYRGQSGDTRNPIPGNEGSPNHLTVGRYIDRAQAYWVRASLACGASHDSATLGFSKYGCNPFVFAPQPQSADLAYGASKVLTVDTPTTLQPPTIHYDWYKEGASTPFASGTSVTVTPTASFRYYVRATNPAGSLDSCSAAADSAVATIRVASCSGITFTQPPGQSPEKGTAADLAVTASGPALSYQWYAGEVGDESHPVGTNSPAYHTPLINDPAVFWVRVRSGSCLVDSATIHVNPCLRTQKLLGHAPYDQTVPSNNYFVSLWQFFTGTGLTYQWYLGEVGDISHPFERSVDIIRFRPIVTATYWVRATSSCWSQPVDSEAFHVSVCPQIVQQPSVAADTVMPGATTTLTALGTNGTVYQWFQGDSGDTSHPFGGNTATVTTPPINAETKFWCRFANGTCYITSEPVTVHLCEIAEVHWASFPHALHLSEPFTLQISYAAPGSQIYFYKGVSGDVDHSVLVPEHPIESLYYQVNPTAPSSTYWVRVKKDSCYSDSATLTLQVCAPTITDDPHDAGITEGGSTALSVVANTTGLTYQWYIGENDDEAHPIAGATGASYIATPADDTRYWVRVTGSCGVAANSHSTLVTVCHKPHITSAAPATQYAIAGSGSSTTVWVIATGTNLTYQWYAGTKGNTANPLAATTAGYTFYPQNTASYWVRVSGSCGTPADSETMLVSVCAPASITAQPQSTIIFSGGTATLSVTATESTPTPLTYQWYAGTTPNNSTVVANATGTSFTTPALTAETNYWVRISCGICAPVDSNVATVSICNYPQVLGAPLSQNIQAGQSATMNTVPGSGNSYQWYVGASGDTSHPAGGSSNSYVYTATPAVTTQYWALVTNGGCISRTQSATISVCVPKITQDPASPMINTGTSTTLSVVATSAVSYQWYRGTTGDTSAPVGTNSASFTTPALTTATSYWVRVTGSCAPAADSAAGTITICYPPGITSTAPAVQPAIRGSGSSSTVWVNATGTNLTYQWYIGNSGNTSSPYGGGVNAALTITPQNPTSYWVRVSGSCGPPVDSITMLVNVCAPPAITTQPQDTTVFSGTSGTLSVVASEATTQAVSYQWYRGNSGDTSNPITGATAASYTTPALTIQTSYWVRVSCGICAPADSQTATVWMCYNPQVLAAPADQFITVGQTATLTAPCCGNTYQWFIGASGNTSQPISSAMTSQSFNVAPSATTQYWAQVVNGGCVSRTQSTTVWVCVPIFTQQPSSVTINPGSSTTLSAAANTAGVTYQWYKGNSGDTSVPVGGATGASVTVTPTATTSYWVRATSTCGRIVDSSTATVTLCAAPNITVQPHDGSPVWGAGNEYFSVNATGSNLTYQWFFGNSGDTSYALSSVSSDPTLTLYVTGTQRVWVRVTGQCGTKDSNSVFASVYPTIWQQPANVIAGYNTTTTITLGTSPNYPTFVWRWANGTPIATTSTPALITPTITTDTGVYCEVWSGSAVTYSSLASINVCYNGPAIYSITKGSGSPCKNVFANTGPIDDIEWYQGARGDTSHLIGHGGTAIIVCDTTPTQYWFRAIIWSSYQVVSCYSDSNAITVP
jgi:YD repeat-containing protein